MSYTLGAPSVKLCLSFITYYILIYTTNNIIYTNIISIGYICAYYGETFMGHTLTSSQDLKFFVLYALMAVPNHLINNDLWSAETIVFPCLCW